LCDWPEEDLQAERAWFGAAGEAFALHTFFSNPPALDAKLSVHTRQLKDYLDELDEALDLRIRAAQKEVTGKARHQLCRLLSSPLLKSAKRGELADKQRRLAVKLHEATDKLDQEDIQAARSPRPADWPAAATERSAPLLRAKTSLALAGLAGEDKKDLPTDQPNVSEREVNVLEKALHALWGSELLDRWRTSRPTPANDVLNRLISPWDWNAKVGAAQRDASLLLQKDQRKSYLRWLAANYQAEAQFLETNTYDRPASEFFVDAAEKLRLHLSGLE
jgi:hypothetical protein